jgi:hypothetical protein
MRTRPSRPFCRTLLPALCATFLAACSSVGKLEGSAPQGVDLSGTWKLNRAASDDPRRLMPRMRAQARPAEDEGPGDEPAPGNSPDGDMHDRGRHRGGMSGGEDAERGGRGMRRRGDLPAQALAEFGPGRNVLQIVQRATEIRIDNGLTVRALTPGGRSLVSLARGVADQRSGWHGKEFVIETRGENLPSVVERFALSPDHRQLVVNLKIEGGGGGRKIELKRVYDTAPASAATLAPST